MDTLPSQPKEDSSKKVSKVTTWGALKSALVPILTIVVGLFIFGKIYYTLFDGPDYSYGIPMFISYIIFLAIALPIWHIISLKRHKLAVSNVLKYWVAFVLIVLVSILIIIGLRIASR